MCTGTFFQYLCLAVLSASSRRADAGFLQLSVSEDSPLRHHKLAYGKAQVSCSVSQLEWLVWLLWYKLLYYCLGYFIIVKS